MQGKHPHHCTIDQASRSVSLWVKLTSFFLRLLIWSGPYRVPSHFHPRPLQVTAVSLLCVYCRVPLAHPLVLLTPCLYTLLLYLTPFPHSTAELCQKAQTFWTRNSSRGSVLSFPGRATPGSVQGSHLAGSGAMGYQGSNPGLPHRRQVSTCCTTAQSRDSEP